MTSDVQPTNTDPLTEQTTADADVDLEIGMVDDQGEDSVIAADEPATGDSLSRLRSGWPLLFLAGGIGALEVARTKFQNRSIFAPTRFPETIGTWEPEAVGLAVEDVYFDSEDGTSLHGWWLEHPRAHMTVVFCHGTSGSIADRVEMLRMLRGLKVNLFAFDYRGYGRSDGKPTEKGLFADVRAALDYVANERSVPLHRIILHGHSLGGAVAIDAAGHRSVAGLIVQSSFTHIRDMARHRHPEGPLPLVARNQFRSLDKVPHLSMPKLFIHASDDPTVPFSHGEALFAAAAEPKQWLPFKRGGHSAVHEAGSLRFLNALIRFRRRCRRAGADQSV